MNRIDQYPGRGSGSSCRAQKNPANVTAAAASQMITPTARTHGVDPDNITMRPAMATASPTYPTRRAQTAILQCRLYCSSGGSSMPAIVRAPRWRDQGHWSCGSSRSVLRDRAEGRLPMLQPDQVADPLHAYQLAKRANSLRVMAEAVRWGKRGARINTISPGIIITPLARDELTGPRGDGYRRMIELCPAGRAGTPDEVGTVGALLMGPDGAFVTGSDFLMDGGVTAAYFYGELAAQ